MTGMSNVTKLAGEPSGQEFLVFTLGDEEGSWWMAYLMCCP